MIKKTEIQPGVWVEQLPNQIGIALSFEGPLGTLVINPDGVVALVTWLEELVDQ